MTNEKSRLEKSPRDQMIPLAAGLLMIGGIFWVLAIAVIVVRPFQLLPVSVDAQQASTAGFRSAAPFQSLPSWK